MSAASIAAYAYGLKEITRLSQSMTLTPKHYDLIKDMFALAWIEGHYHGVNTTSQAVLALLKGLEPPAP